MIICLTPFGKGFINLLKLSISDSIWLLRRVLGMAFKVSVDREKCKGCEDCLEACTVNVFEMKEGKSLPENVKECLGCGTCVEVCKEKAIVVEELKPDLSEVARSLLGDIL
jgi:NAD-dependent dihydropyrimidine dehydrogenase PreA subunit